MPTWSLCYEIYVHIYICFLSTAYMLFPCTVINYTSSAINYCSKNQNPSHCTPSPAQPSPDVSIDKGKVILLHGTDIHTVYIALLPECQFRLI